MAALFDPHFQAISSTGAPYSGAKLYFYQTGTTTKLTIYSDNSGTTQLNPVTADASGLFAPVYVTNATFKVLLTTSADVVIQTIDPCFIQLVAGATFGFGDGLVGTPAITFANDLDTGIYRIGTNNMGFAAGGALVAQIDGNGLAVKDSLFTLFDDGDATKKAKFQLSGITTGQTRTYTFPDSDGTLALGTSFQPLDADLTLMASLGFTGFFGFHNRLINGNGSVNQRVYTTVADDTYWCDRHYVLTQTSTVTPTIVSNPANGVTSIMRLTQSQASAQRMGNAQIIESLNCRDLRGQTVTLIGKLQCSASQAIRYAVLEWTGTADGVTSDVVNDWTSATFTGGNFFVSTTTNVLAVGSTTPSGGTLTDFLLTATVGSSATNLIVLIWTEATAAQNVTLDVAWELHRGNMTGQVYPLEVRSAGQEVALCNRYFQRIGGNRANECLGMAAAASSTASRSTVMYPGGSMRRGSGQTVTFGTASLFQLDDGNGSNVVLSAISSSPGPSLTSIGLSLTVASGLTTGRAYMFETNTTGGTITVDDEL